MQVAFLTFLSLACLCGGGGGDGVRRFIPRTRLTTNFLVQGLMESLHPQEETDHPVDRCMTSCKL